MGYPWAYKVRVPDQSKGARSPDYFKIFAAPIVVVAASVYAILFMDPPEWAVFGSIGLSALMVVGSFAYLSYQKRDIDNLARLGPGMIECEICSLRLKANEYQAHLWRRHYDTSKEMERASKQMVWWVLGVAAISCAITFLIVGFSLASLVVAIVIGPLLGLIVTVGVTIQVRWPRIAERARREWLETHPGWDPAQYDPDGPRRESDIGA